MFFKKSNREPIDVYLARDYARIPEGHFICIKGTGGKSLGHNGPLGLTWQARRPATLTDEQLRALPVVKLHQFIGLSAIGHVAGRRLLDSASLDLFDGDFVWDGD